MTKEAILQAMESAEELHMLQMQKIVDAISGEKIENPTPLGKMECECGEWFYKHEDIMKQILSPQLFERLDKAHERWHYEYANIYNLYFKEEQKDGFFAKIIRKKVSKELYDKARYYYEELQHATDELLHISLTAKRRISALPESKFSALEG